MDTSEAGTGVLFKRYASSSSSEGERRKRHKSGKSHKSKKKLKKKKEKKSKKDKKSKRSKDNARDKEQPDAVRREDLQWMSQDHALAALVKPPAPAPPPAPNEETPIVRPYGLYDPKKGLAKKQENEEEVDEFGRTIQRKEPITAPVSRPSEMAPRSVSSSAQREVVGSETISEPGSESVTQDMLNKVVAEALRAQLKGDTQRYKELTAKVGKMKLLVREKPKVQEPERLTPVDEKGQVLRSLKFTSSQVPLAKEDLRSKSRRGMRFHESLVEKDGQLKAHFTADLKDNDKSVKEMLRDEMSSRGDSLDDAYIRNLVKKGSKFKDTMLDRSGIESEEVDVTLFETKQDRMTDRRLHEHERSRAATAHRKMSKAQMNSPFSFQNPNFTKSLVLAVGKHTYLMLPFNPLAKGHVRVVPLEAIPGWNEASDEVVSEMNMFKDALEKMALADSMSVVYMETVMNAKRIGWHTCIECIPVEEEVAEIIPMCFKKALLDSDAEWSQHKKVIDTSQKPISRAIPAGFPYFHVQWAGGGYAGGGYAHVIEDTQRFPASFGADVLCGAMGNDPSKFNQKMLGAQEDKRRVLEFREKWKKYDWTAQES